MPSTVPAGWPGYKKPASPLVNAGVVYVGETAVGMGATEGGLTFDPGKEIRNVPFDGKTTDVAKLDRVIVYNSRITGRFKDISETFIGYLEPGSASDGSAGKNTITPKTAHSFFQSGDYLRNVTFVGLCGDGSTRRVFMAWALVESYTLATTDKEEGLFDISIKAVLGPDTDGEDLNAPPFTWEVEDAA